MLRRVRAASVRPVAAVMLAVLSLMACTAETDAPDDAAVDDGGTGVGEPDVDTVPDDGSDPVTGTEPAPPGAEPDGGGDDDDHGEEPAGSTPDLSVELRLTDVADMRAPTAGAVGPDGVLHLAERSGTVHRLEGGELGPAVLDLSSETTSDGERGLLGLAFAADGSELFASWTDLGGDTLIAGFPLDGDGRLLDGERRTILTQEQPFANHNGGGIVVGPDGLLYIGLGDGGGGGDPHDAGQDLTTLLGSLLRIDPSAGSAYGVPRDNPFVGDDEARGEIWAYGLRNPWRFSFDRETGALTIADVGQDAREEINWIAPDEPGGVNFGWSLMEGTREFAGAAPENHRPPVHEYETRGPGGCAITGGYVYRGEAIPALRGAYVYSDFCDAGIRAIVIEDGEVTDSAALGVGGGQIVSFVEDDEGELYVLDFAGAVRRIDPAG